MIGAQSMNGMEVFVSTVSCAALSQLKTVEEVLSADAKLSRIETPAPSLRVVRVFLEELLQENKS